MRLTILLDAAPVDPRSLKLRAWDRTFLLDSVASVLREIPAAVKASWDAIWEPDPKFLGPQETDLAAAVAHPAPRPAG